MTDKIDNFSGRYRFLSNFYASPIAYKGKVYPTVEHAYQAAKTSDPAWHEVIRTAGTPSIAKRHGNNASLPAGWDKIKFDIMYELLKIKFAPGSSLANLLLATGDAILIEGNTWNDTCWGVCRGKGDNNLGKLLMQVRDELG